MDWNIVAAFLRSTLETHEVAGTNTVIMYSDGWKAVFESSSGALVKVHSQGTVCPEGRLSAGTIKTLELYIKSLRFDKDFFRTMRTNALLQELNVSYRGHNLFYYAGHISRIWHTSACPFLFTLYDRVKGTHDQVVAQLAIGGSDSQSSRKSILDVYGCESDAPISQQQVSEAPVDFVFLQWDCDHVFSALSDYSALFLEMATKQHPQALTTFTLDASQLSAVGLSSIREVFSRSNLEQLHVVCTPVDFLSKFIAQVLASIQWNTLKSLILSGDKIDEWCHFWPLLVSPRLLSLQIQRSSPTVQDLPHRTVLLLQRLIFSSPLVDLRFRNFQFQDKHDWALLIESVDLSLLQILDLGDHGTIQFLSEPNAIGLFVSGLQATRLETDIPKLILPSFMLDITTLPQLDLMRIQVIVSHCILEKIVIKCDPIGLNLLHLPSKVLNSVHWSLLKHLVLLGDDINRWIQLLTRADLTRLTTLQIRGTKSVQQELSHDSILFIERLVGMDSFIGLQLGDVLLHDPHAWVRLTNNMDVPMLKNLYLEGGSGEQFMATQDAVNIYISKWKQWKVEQREEKNRIIAEEMSRMFLH